MSGALVGPRELSEALVGLVKLIVGGVLLPITFFTGKAAREHRRVISETARTIAARRALETERQDRLINDPLARILAGKDAMNRAKDHNRNEDGDGRRKRIVPNVVILRARFIDDAIQNALGVARMAEFASLRSLPNLSQCRQVVVLGAGMDARPWRLVLPQGVTWFEVDLGNVVNLKKKLLKDAEAAMSSEANKTARFPLRCSRWCAVTGDVEHKRWLDTIVDAGFMPEATTLWVLEGLLVYLEPQKVPELLKSLAQKCGPDSLLMASFVMQKRLAEHQQHESKARAAWKWGAPDDFDVFFEKNGWTINVLKRWTHAAKMYGCRATHPRTSARPLSEQMGLMIAKKI